MAYAIKDIRILFVGGGTGGHVFPLVGVARSIRRLASERGLGEPAMAFAGPDHFARETVLAEGISFFAIQAPKLRRYFSLETFLDIGKIPVGLLQALWTLWWFMPDIVLAKGGYGSAFPVLAAWLYRIPIILHESDSVTGLTNGLASRFASHIFFSFALDSNSAARLGAKAETVGNPIRETIPRGSKEEGKALFQVGSAKPVILIQGGSQGAQAINELVLQALPELLARFEIIHLVGSAHFEAIREVALRNTSRELHAFYHPAAFINEQQLAHAYAVADCIVSRAGSGSIFEIAAAGKPSILIPLPNAAKDHQKKNAYIYADTEAAIVMEQQNLTPHVFVQTLSDLMNDPQKQALMGAKARQFAKPSAADAIAEFILQRMYGS